MNKSPENAFEQELTEGLDKLEGWFPAEAPSLIAMEQLVAAEQKQWKRRIVRDLALLWVVGLTVISVLLLALAREPLMFIIVQLAALLGFPLTGLLRNKRRRQVETL